MGDAAAQNLEDRSVASQRSLCGVQHPEPHTLSVLETSTPAEGRTWLWQMRDLVARHFTPNR